MCARPQLASDQPHSQARGARGGFRGFLHTHALRSTVHVTEAVVSTFRHGKRVKRSSCTTRLLAAPATFTIPAIARASLTRNHVLYATGTTPHARVVLHARRSVPAGSYSLILHYLLHGHPTTTRTPITIR